MASNLIVREQKLRQRNRNKHGGPLVPDAEAEALMRKFHNTLGLMTRAETISILAGVGHPALTISWYLHRRIELCGCSELLPIDTYCQTHIGVEPEHIIHAAGRTLQCFGAGEKDAVVAAFRRVMAFQEEYWPVAFSRLNYPRIAHAA